MTQPQPDAKVTRALELLEEAGASIEDLIDAGYQPTMDDAVATVNRLVDIPPTVSLPKELLEQIGVGNLDRAAISAGIGQLIGEIRLRRLGVNANIPGAEKVRNASLIDLELEHDNKIDHRKIDDLLSRDVIDQELYDQKFLKNIISNPKPDPSDRVLPELDRGLPERPLGRPSESRLLPRSF